jgi:hypothetical protein
MFSGSVFNFSINNNNTLLNRTNSIYNLIQKLQMSNYINMTNDETGLTEIVDMQSTQDNYLIILYSNGKLEQKNLTQTSIITIY